MENRSFLTLIEQQIMILVFAVASAICIKTFAHSDLISKDTEIRDGAVIAAQNAAECVISTRGDLEGAAALMGGTGSSERWEIRFDGEWNSSDSGEYTVVVTRTDDSGLCGTASVEVFDGEDMVYDLTASWQKEETDG